MKIKDSKKVTKIKTLINNSLLTPNENFFFELILK